jgi:uncharacterized protein with HEPN domain
MKDDRLYLLHILECIDRIDAFTTGNRQAFMDSVLIQDAVIKKIDSCGIDPKAV